MKHELKTWPRPYGAVVEGQKRFEYRLDDRGFECGDTILLREWDPDTGAYTGQYLMVRVTYIASGPDFGIRDGFVVMSIEPAL